MVEKVLRKQILGVGLLLLSGCDAARNARNDLSRLFDSHSPAARSSSTAGTGAGQPQGPRKSDPAADRKTSTANAPADSGGLSANLTGKSEDEIRALLGPPSSEEERAPGKVWRYRDGRCTLDIRLFPDVRTHQFGTLEYEVKSDDNTNEGKRLCVAQLQSRTQAAR